MYTSLNFCALRIRWTYLWTSDPYYGHWGNSYIYIRKWIFGDLSLKLIFFWKFDKKICWKNISRKEIYTIFEDIGKYTIKLSKKNIVEKCKQKFTNKTFNCLDKQINQIFEAFLVIIYTSFCTIWIIYCLLLGNKM